MSLTPEQLDGLKASAEFGRKLPAGVTTMDLVDLTIGLMEERDRLRGIINELGGHVPETDAPSSRRETRLQPVIDRILELREGNDGSWLPEEFAGDTRGAIHDALNSAYPGFRDATTAALERVSTDLLGYAGEEDTQREIVRRALDFALDFK